METQYTYPPKPTLVNVIAWMTLASGIVNLIWGLVTVASIWWTIICIPFAILPTVLGIFEVIYAAKLLSNPPQAMQPSTTIAILEIICIVTLNAFALAVGILALVFYNDLTVRDYFARLNGMPTPVAPPVPVPPVAPAPPVDPAPAPEPEPPTIAPEEISPVEESFPPEPESEQKPKKPRGPRKVAK